MATTTKTLITGATLTPASGTGNGELTLTVPANPGIVDREVSFQISGGGKICKINVIQQAGPIVMKLEKDSTGQKFPVLLYRNIPIKESVTEQLYQSVPELGRITDLAGWIYAEAYQRNQFTFSVTSEGGSPTNSCWYVMDYDITGFLLPPDLPLIDSINGNDGSWGAFMFIGNTPNMPTNELCFFDSEDINWGHPFAYLQACPFGLIQAQVGQMAGFFDDIENYSFVRP